MIALDTNLGLLTAELPVLLSGKQSVARTTANAQANFEQQQVAPPTPEPPLAPFTVATPRPEAPAPAVDAITIRFGASGMDTTVVEQLRQEYAREQPTIAVHVQQGFGDSIATLAQQSDCFSAIRPANPDEISALLDLQPLLSAEPLYKPDNEFRPDCATQVDPAYNGWKNAAAP